MKAFSFESRDVEGEPDVVQFDLRGYIDAHTVIEFEKAVNSTVDTGHKRVILDISGLSYISSAGIGAFRTSLTTFRVSSRFASAFFMPDVMSRT